MEKELAAGSATPVTVQKEGFAFGITTVEGIGAMVERTVWGWEINVFTPDPENEDEMRWCSILGGFLSKKDLAQLKIATDTLTTTLTRCERRRNHGNQNSIPLALNTSRCALLRRRGTDFRFRRR